MPASKVRHPHKHPQQHDKPLQAHTKPKQSNRLMIVSIVFFSFLGLCIGYFTNGADTTSLIIGIAVGALVGFVLGYSITKSIANK